MIRFYQLYVEEINPASALNEAKKWLRNVTATALILWLKNLAVQIITVNPSICERIQDEIISLKQNSVNINNNTSPYAHPYYWAGFTINSMLKQ